MKLLSHACFLNTLPTDCSTSDLGDAKITVSNLGISIPSAAIENVASKMSFS